MAQYSLQSVFPSGDMLNINLLESILNLEAETEVSAIRYENRLDLLSYDYYNTTDLWWLLAYYNSIENPMNFDKETLLVPSFEDIKELLDAYIQP